MDRHTAMHQNAMSIGASYLGQHSRAIQNDNAIRLANARQNAEAVGRQRRYDQAIGDRQRERNVQERMHNSELALKSLMNQAKRFR